MSNKLPNRVDIENLSAFTLGASCFFRYAEERTRGRFRTPESYSPLLYGMAKGKHRLSELADFSGYSLKKCQTYLRTLCSCALAEKVDLPGGDRRSRCGYFLESGYLRFWCRFLMYPCQEEQNIPRMMTYIDQVIIPDLFRKLAYRWLTRKEPLNHDEIQDYRKKEINDISFDFVKRQGHRMLFVRIWTELNTSHNGAEFDHMIGATEKINPFYDNDYYLFSIHRFTDSMWERSRKYDNLHLIEARFLN